jgi:hypothetical protein
MLSVEPELHGFFQKIPQEDSEHVRYPPSAAPHRRISCTRLSGLGSPESGPANLFRCVHEVTGFRKGKLPPLSSPSVQKSSTSVPR